MRIRVSSPFNAEFRYDLKEFVQRTRLERGEIACRLAPQNHSPQPAMFSAQRASQKSTQ